MTSAATAANGNCNTNSSSSSHADTVLLSCSRRQQQQQQPRRSVNDDDETARTNITTDDPHVVLAAIVANTNTQANHQHLQQHGCSVTVAPAAAPMNGLACVHLSTNTPTLPATTQTTTSCCTNSPTTTLAESTDEAFGKRPPHSSEMKSVNTSAATVDRRSSGGGCHVVLARVCESELASVRRASGASGPPMPPVRRQIAGQQQTAVRMLPTQTANKSDKQQQCKSSNCSGAMSSAQAVGINAEHQRTTPPAAAEINDHDEDPYAELEYYLENVKVRVK